MNLSKQKIEQEAVLTMQRQSLTAKDRLIVALDVSNMAEARALMAELGPEVGMFKIGLELFTSCGTQIFDTAREYGAKLFFDCKFHDIPNTVAGACRAAVRNRPAIFNIHALGGSKMMEAAVAARNEAFEDVTQRLAPERAFEKPLLIAVTILTSMNAKALSSELKVSMPLDQMVPYLAALAKESGLDGVVASAQEAAAIRQACGPDFLIVTPGIRPSWAGADDQSRIVTPKDAIAGGADMIVVGRPITNAKDKKEAAKKIVAELEMA